jgi:hypothetical protein
MNIDHIKQTLASKKGANLKATWVKTLKTRKEGRGFKVEKITSIVVRGGIDYENMGIVQEKREDGSLPSENAGLPWGTWAEFPLHIEHKGTDYARFYPASGINVATGEPFKPEVTYLIDGVEVPSGVEGWMRVRSLCLASEFPKRVSEPLCFTVKADNVLSIG